MNNLFDTEIELHNRILTNPTFVKKSYKNSKLIDPVVVYNDNREWKIIPLYIFNMYPVIHDLYFENKKAHIITVYVCPYTLFTCIYFGEYIPYNKVYNNNVILKNNNDADKILIPITSKILSISDQKVLDEYFYRKNEAKIITLRNAISTYPDCQFINIEKINKIQSIINQNYLENQKIYYDIDNYSSKYPPKQIIYIIEYKSKTSFEYKYTAIIPKKNDFDIQKNGFNDYFIKMIDQIREKGGMIYTCLWFAWDATHPDTKIIKL